MLTALRLYLRDAIEELSRGAERVAVALDTLAAAQGAIVLPGYTHMQQAMPSSVALWAGGFASEIRDDAEGLRLAQRRIAKNPLGSAAGYGTPGLPLDREVTRRALGFTSVHEPVTAVQLSRGKGEAQILFELVLLMQDLARLADRCAAFLYPGIRVPLTARCLSPTGSSIMPQKRNPGCVRAVARDAPRWRRPRSWRPSQSRPNYPLDISAICSCSKHHCFAPLTWRSRRSTSPRSALPHSSFERTAFASIPGVHAAAAANTLVVNEGIPFREAYRRVGARLAAEAPTPVHRRVQA